jgi:hypothetical protein
VFCDGFQISGQIETGQFGRLSDWIKMQTGFIPVQNASIRRLGTPDVPDPRQGGTTQWARNASTAPDEPDPHQSGTTQWVRIAGIALLAERAASDQDRPQALVVPKQAHSVSMAMPGYRLSGSMHIHSEGSVSEYLASPDARFLPITDVVVRPLSDPTLVIRYDFALVNRDLLVSIVNGH